MMARTATTAAFSAPKYPGPARSAANNAKVRSAVAYVKDQLRRGDLKGASENLAKGATITGLMDAVEREPAGAERFERRVDFGAYARRDIHGCAARLEMQWRRENSTKARVA